MIIPVSQSEVPYFLYLAPRALSKLKNYIAFFTLQLAPPSGTRKKYFIYFLFMNSENILVLCLIFKDELKIQNFCFKLTKKNHQK